MIDKKIEQLKIIKNITLTPQERSILRASVARGIQISRQKPVVSIFHRGIQYGLRMGLSTFIFIIFVGGSVSVVADNSLPGDPLYSFKINVNEEIEGSFIKNPADRLSWQTNRIDKRLSEIKTLAASKTLTKAKQETAQKALNIHIEALSKGLNTLSDEAPSKALEITSSIEKNLQIQKEDIKQYISEENKDKQASALKAVDIVLQKVSDQEVKIISKEIDQLSTEINSLPDTTGLKDLNKGLGSKEVPIDPLKIYQPQ